MMTAWTEFYAPDASTDRGWLKAITEEWTIENRSQYTHNTMPVWDDDIHAWREQSTLGNYLDYGPVRCHLSAEYMATNYADGCVHAVCYASGTSRYLRTVQAAKQWIESESKRVRPELTIQGGLFA